MKRYTKPKSKILAKGFSIKQTKKVYAACGDCPSQGPDVGCACVIEQQSA